MPDDNRPATKQDLQELRDTLIGQMRDMQTEVLRAFHNWAKPAEVKLRSHEERITLLEERISRLEFLKALPGARPVKDSRAPSIT